MWLKYSNQRNSGIWLVVGYLDKGCDEGSDWASKGWFRIEPGGSVTPLWTTNEYSTFYAEADDGAVWNGPYTVTVPFDPFDGWCWDLGVNPGESIGMQLVTATNPGLPWVATINLT
ncbi:DUF1036 domain-containing protein [Kitasatospora sp. NBC_00374]|uniref:hypothetical protein n=1 Tax=Kitasatospora sp. NBC_00374 TaxID=2975964 RepID=UPI0030E3AE36